MICDSCGLSGTHPPEICISLLRAKVEGWRKCGHQNITEECGSCRHDAAVEQLCTEQTKVRAFVTELSEAKILLKRFLNAGPEEEYQVLLCKLSSDVEAFLSEQTQKRIDVTTAAPPGLYHCGKCGGRPCTCTQIATAR
jgi:hypothetical protein